MAGQHLVHIPPPHERRGNAAPSGKPDTSKLTCFKCGKVGHFANDPKCPQYKKPEQQRMFAAQIVNDLSDAERLNQSANVVDKNSMLEPKESGTHVPDPESET